MQTRDQVLAAVIQFKLENDGNSPERNHLAEMLNLSKASIRYHMDQLRIEQRLFLLPGSRGHMVIPGAAWLSPEHCAQLLELPDLPEEIRNILC